MPSLISFGTAAGRAYGLTSKKASIGDPYFSNVTILLHFNGLGGSTIITDSSSSNLTMTNISSLNTINTSTLKFGTGSLYFPGTSNLTNPNTATTLVGLNNNFTIEFWFYLSGIQGAWKGLCGNYLDSSFSTRSSWAIGMDGTGTNVQCGIKIVGGNGYIQTPGYSVSANVWYHLAFVRSGSTFTQYIDGLSTSSFTYAGAFVDGGSNLEVGSYINGGYRFTGFMDEFRITNGVARYTSNFTPQTSEFLNFGSDEISPTIASIAIFSSAGIQNSYLNATDSLIATVTFSETVILTGNPLLAANIGGSILNLTYSTGSPGNIIYFSYASLPAGYNDSDGISFDANALTLNGGTIKDVAGNDANLTSAAVAANASYKVDTTAPTGGSISVDAAGTVTVSGLESGATWQYSINSGSSWSAGSGTTFTLLAGTYAVGVVQVRQIDLAGNIQTVNIASNTSIITIASPALQVAYTTAGTYSWIAPAGVTSVCVVCIGGGGGGGGGNQMGGAGAGGNLRYVNNISVTPGSSYTVTVGDGGNNGVSNGVAGSGGGYSAFSSYCLAAGGGAGSTVGGTAGGGDIGTGGNGGAGGNPLTYDGGGGGGGGYSGNGGTGSTGYNGAATAGSGGGGGGGGGGSGGAGGGGTGILGQGSNGSAGVSPGAAYQSLSSGGGGSGGKGGGSTTSSGVSGVGGGTYANGGTYGGGGGGGYNGGRGGTGAVRIIWSSGRSFPSTNTQDM